MSDKCKCGHERLLHTSWGDCLVERCGCKEFLPTPAEETGQGKRICMACDGCGWVEGGKTLKTPCTACGGTGAK